MYIKCWGSRGSIPVSGREYLKYGGDTTCIEIRAKSDDIIIIDAGTGIRRLGNQLIKEKRFQFHFIFTHAHWDHVMGFPYFKPLYFKNAQFQMHRCPFHSKFVEKILSKVMAPPNFPIKYADITAQISYSDANPKEFEIGSVSVVPVALSHPNGGSGYKFIEDGRCFVFLTDNELGYIHPGGLAFGDYLEFSRGADLLLRQEKGGSGGRYHVLLHHDRSHVVGAEEHRQLPDFHTLRHPTRLNVRNVVQVEPGQRCHPEVLVGVCEQKVFAVRKGV